MRGKSEKLGGSTPYKKLGISKPTREFLAGRYKPEPKPEPLLVDFYAEGLIADFGAR